MQEINIIYDYYFDEIINCIIVTGTVDIISVPNDVVNNLDKIVQTFFDWAYSADSDCWIETEGVKTCCADANDFVRWLNKYYMKDIKELAYVVRTKTNYDPSLRSAEF